MRRTLTTAIALALLAAVTGSAHAQQYKWIDKNGKVVYGDAPPPGAKASPLKPPPAPVNVPTPAGAKDAAAKDAAGKDAAGKDASAKDAKKGPMTAAEQEADFRRRQKEAEKAREKVDQEAKQAAAMKENCDRAQEMARTLQSGERIQRTDEKGERYYLDDSARVQEMAKAQKIVSDSCK